MGKLSLVGCLIAPMAMSMALNSVPDGNFISIFWIMYTWAGSILFVYIMAFFLYLVI